MKRTSLFLFLVSFLLTGCNQQSGTANSENNKTEEHTHEFSSDFKYDNSHHWHEATCEHTELTQGLEEHTFDEGGKCVCGYERVIPHIHTFSDEYSKDENYHWKDSTCDHTGLTSEFGSHVFNDQDICEVCGYSVPEIVEKCTIYFHTLCELLIDPITVNKGEKASIPSPNRYDYNFINWYTNPEFEGEPFDSETLIVQDTNLYAKFEAKVCPVVFDLNGGEWPNNNSGTFTVQTKCGEVPVPPGVPHKGNYDVGHHFIGWQAYSDGEMGLKVVHEDDGEVWYKAIYGEPYYVSFEVTFHDFDGGILKTVRVPYAYPLTDFPENPEVPSSYKHCYFTHWTLDKVGGEEFQSGEYILGNYHLYPNVTEYESHTVTVKVGTNGGDGRGKINGVTEDLTFKVYEDSNIFVVPGLYTSKGQLKIDGEVFVEAIPEQGNAQFNYWFGGWKIEGGEDWYINETYKIDKDVTIIAIFGRNTNSYRVTWNVNGTDVSSDLWDYGVVPSYKGETPYKEGYVFDGWEPEIGKVTGNITYTAKFRDKAFNYTLDENNSVVITGLGDFVNDEVINIPDKIDGKTVVKVTTGAFKNCANVKFVNILANPFAGFDQNTFDSCPNLCEITVNDTLYRRNLGYISIDETCATNCPNLTSVTFNDGFLIIGTSDPRTAGVVNHSNGRYEFVYQSDSFGRKFFVLPEYYDLMPGEGVPLVRLHVGQNGFKSAPFEHIVLPYAYDYLTSTIVDCLKLKTLTLSQYCWDLPAGFADNCPELTTVYFEGDIETFNKNIEVSSIFTNCPKLTEIICSDGTIDLTK